MDAHLVCIPRLTTLSTWRLPRGDLERLGRQAYGALNSQVFPLCALNELLADFFEGLDFAGGERDADFVDFLYRKKIVVSIRQQR